MRDYLLELGARIAKKDEQERATVDGAKNQAGAERTERLREKAMVNRRTNQSAKALRKIIAAPFQGVGAPVHLVEHGRDSGERDARNNHRYAASAGKMLGVPNCHEKHSGEEY